MYLATLETPNFEFLAVGDTREEALAAMRKGWQNHIQGCDTCWKWEEIEQDIFVRFTRTGDFWRDGTLTLSSDKPNN